jgi:hypothetical protein
MLGVLPFSVVLGLSVLLLDWPSGWRASSPSPMLVAMAVLTVPSAFIVAVVGWAARLSPVLSERYELDNRYRLAFLGVSLGYAIPTIVALIAAIIGESELDTTIVLALLTFALFCLTGWWMIPFAAWGIRVYADRARPFLGRWTPLVMVELPSARGAPIE